MAMAARDVLISTYTTEAVDVDSGAGCSCQIHYTPPY